MWSGCGWSPWGADDSQECGRSSSSGFRCRGGESRAAFPGCSGRYSGKLLGTRAHPEAAAGWIAVIFRGTVQLPGIFPSSQGIELETGEMPRSRNTP